MRNITLVLLVVFLSGCSTFSPWYNPEVKGWEEDKAPTTKPYYSLFLIGDAGHPDADQQEPSFKLMQGQIKEMGKASGVVWLGDNLYPVGLPDKDDPTREEAERRLKEQVDAAANIAGTFVMLPGNHDWGQGGKDGYARVRRAEKFLENYAQAGNIWQPNKGCPGPEVIDLADDVVLIVIDTQWWLHRWEKPNHELDCEVKYNADFIEMLHQAIEQNKDKKVIVSAHHPMYSYGAHGGYFPWETHIFPGLMAKEKFYVPIPLLGTAAVLQRKLWGNIQDIPHPIYQDLKHELTSIFEQYPNLVYACGHDHNLQYLPIKEQHYIVSGAGCKRRYAGHGKKADFTYAHTGFSRLDYYDSGDVWMSFWIPEGDGTEGKLVYQKKLFNKPAPKEVEIKAPRNVDYKDSTITLIADDRYDRGGFFRALFGDNYRKEWGTEITVPLFDIWSRNLRIEKRGGGHQTKSLRLVDVNDRDYVLRSVAKYPEKATPEMLRGTFAGEVIQDQISASHPYSAFIIPPLAEAAGVFHTNPQLVFLPDDPRLGEYQEDFGGTLYLFEERPDDDRSDVASFGRSTKIISTLDLIDKMQEENDHFVNQKECLRARLFDMWLGDWDRHADQWRWAKFDVGSENIYKPIPRDRDVVFFRPEGFLAWLSLRKWAIRDVQEFDPEIRDVLGHGNASKYWDRYFLTELEEEDWKEIAEALHARLSAEVIESALAMWPKQIYEISGPQIVAALKSRREHMVEYAEEYYKFLAEEVDIVMSDMGEVFEVNREENGDTRVRVWNEVDNDKKGRKLYDRTFKKKETKEIRIWGLGGKDIFEVKGKAKKGIKVRIIGGPDEDEFEDKSEVAGLFRKTLYYDRKDKDNKVEGGEEFRDMRSTSIHVNDYERRAFKFDYTGPLLDGGFNIDDGIFIGAGLNFRKYAFRKDPYSLSETISGSYAIATGAFQVSFRGHYPQAVWGWDFVAEVDIQVPNYVTNFYGLGNETVILNEDDIGYHRVRFKQFRVSPALRKTMVNNSISFQVGLVAERIELERTADRFVTEVIGPSLDSMNSFEPQTFVGSEVKFQIDTRDSEIFPTRGINWKNYAAAHKGVSEFAPDYASIGSEMSLYFRFRTPLETVLALRVGAHQNFGDFRFWHAQSLGGRTNLRGYRNTRFSGRGAFYQNTELRIKLGQFSSILFPAQFGIFGINDIGKVWVDEAESEVMHWGYGGGVWISPFNALTVTGAVAGSKQGWLPYVTFGWLF